MPASTQVQRNHTIRGDTTEASVSICEHFDFQLQDHNGFFPQNFLEVPTLQECQDFFKT